MFRSSGRGDAGWDMPGEAGRLRPARAGEARSTMVHTRYEVRVNGRLSERARGAFCMMDVRFVPPQTIMFGELAEQSELCDLLALCSAMGLEVVSLQRLPH
jgi:hypothetical protein